MGARANLVIIEGGQREIFYHTWAAIGIPSRLLAGPQGICKDIRESEFFCVASEKLTDTVWAEGGLVVNCDTHQVTYWGGELYHYPYVRRYIAPVWKEIWPGWRITWTIFGQPDIARACGIDPAEVIVTQYDSPVFLFEDDSLLLSDQVNVVSEEDREYYRYLLSLRFSANSVGDYELAVPRSIRDDMSDASPLDIALTLGPSLIERVLTLAPAPLEQEDCYCGGVAVDIAKHQMVYWNRFAIDERKLPALARRWPGWDIQAVEDGPQEHMALLGRTPSAFFVPKQICLQKMIDALGKYVRSTRREACYALLMHIYAKEFTD